MEIKEYTKKKEVRELIKKLENYDVDLYKKSIETSLWMEKFIDFSDKAARLKEKRFKEQCIVGALLHDIGFLHVPRDIIRKKETKLKKIDLATIKKHPECGFLEASSMIQSPIIFQMILQHHESMDGSGYPFGLSGNKIALESRMLTIIVKYLELRISHPIDACKELLELEAFANRIDAELCREFIALMEYENDFDI